MKGNWFLFCFASFHLFLRGHFCSSSFNSEEYQGYNNKFNRTARRYLLIQSLILQMRTLKLRVQQGVEFRTPNSAEGI